MAIYLPTGAVAGPQTTVPLALALARAEKEPRELEVPPQLPLKEEQEEQEEEVALSEELEPEEMAVIAARLAIDPEKVVALEGAFLSAARRSALMPEQPSARAMLASVEDAVSVAVRGSLEALATTYPLALQMAQSEDSETTRGLVLRMSMFVPVPPAVCVAPLAKARRAGIKLEDARERTDYFIEMLSRMAPLRRGASIFREERVEYESIATELEAVDLTSLANAMRDWLWTAVPEFGRKLPKPQRPEAAPAMAPREPQAWLDAGTRARARKMHEDIWEAIEAQAKSRPRTAGEAEAKIRDAFSTIRDQTPLFMTVMAGMNHFVLLAGQVEGTGGDTRVREAIAELEFLTPMPTVENSEVALACAVKVARELSLEQRVRYYIDDVLPKIAPFAPPEMELIVMAFESVESYLTMIRDFVAVGGDEMTLLANSLSYWLRIRA